MSASGVSHAEAEWFQAQHGEDRILAAHFAGRAPGFYVEVGAFNGVDMSNSYYFEQIGWSGILVEADPDLAARCRSSRPRASVVECAVVAPGGPSTVTFEILVGAEALSSISAGALQPDARVRRVNVVAKTLDSILEEHAPGPIDFVTIDVEGHEWDALQGFDLQRWQPETLLLERNQTRPDWRILNRLASAGYAYARTTGVNDWFHRTGRSLTGSLTYRLWLCYCFYVFRPLSGPYYHVKHLLKLGLSRVRLRK